MCFTILPNAFEYLILIYYTFVILSEDIKTELGKKLKERFDEILEKVKDAIENGKVVKEETLEKVLLLFHSNLKHCFIIKISNNGYKACEEIVSLTGPTNYKKHRIRYLLS